MVNLIEKAKEMLDKNEKILKEIVVQRAFLLKPISTIIFLTNKRIIYFRNGVFKTINLSDIAGISFISYYYLRKIYGSAGKIKIITKAGKGILISPSIVNQLEAYEFINKLKKKIR